MRTPAFAAGASSARNARPSAAARSAPSTTSSPCENVASAARRSASVAPHPTVIQRTFERRRAQAATATVLPEPGWPGDHARGPRRVAVEPVVEVLPNDRVRRQLREIHHRRAASGAGARPSIRQSSSVSASAYGASAAKTSPSRNAPRTMRSAAPACSPRGGDVVAAPRVVGIGDVRAHAARVHREEVEVQRDVVAERDVVRERRMTDDRGERAPHRAARAAQALRAEQRIRVRPERLDQLAAARAAVGPQREVREDLAVAAANPLDALPADAHLRRAEQLDRERQQRARRRRRRDARQPRDRAVRPAHAVDELHEHAARFQPVQRRVVDRIAVEEAARALGERRLLIGERRIDELFDEAAVRALPALERAVERVARRRRVAHGAAQRERPAVRVHHQPRDVALVAPHDARAFHEPRGFVGGERQPAAAAERREAQRDQARRLEQFARARRVQKRRVLGTVEDQPLQQVAPFVRGAVGVVDEDLTAAQRPPAPRAGSPCRAPPRCPARRRSRRGWRLDRRLRSGRRRPPETATALRRAPARWSCRSRPAPRAGAGGSPRARRAMPKAAPGE